MLPNENTFKHLLICVWSQLAQGTQAISCVYLARKTNFLTSRQCWSGKHIGKSPYLMPLKSTARKSKPYQRTKHPKYSEGFEILPDLQGGTYSLAARVTSKDTQWIWDPVLDPNLENSNTDQDVFHQDIFSIIKKEICSFISVISKYQCRNMTRRLVDLSGFKVWQNSDKNLALNFETKLEKVDFILLFT